MQTLVIGNTRLSGGEPTLGVGAVTLERSCFHSNPSAATARYVILVYRMASGVSSLLPGIPPASADHSDLSSCLLHTYLKRVGTGVEGVEVQ